MEAPDVPTVDQLKERVRRDWTDVATIEAWRRWREPFAVHTASLTEALLDAARIEPGQRVLDLASGAGEPALTLARRVGPEGRVTATDVSPGWLQVIEDAALAESLGNIDLVVADAHDLPFPDQAFDRLTSRLGVMFFADVQRALAECRRVVEADGRVAFLVWGSPEKNLFFDAVLRALAARVELPAPVPGAPGPLRFAAEGSLSRELEQAGFREIEEERLIVPVPWPGPPEQLWQHLRQIVAPLRPVIDGLSPADRDAVALGGHRDLCRSLRRDARRPDGRGRGRQRPSLSDGPGALRALVSAQLRVERLELARDALPGVAVDRRVTAFGAHPLAHGGSVEQTLDARLRTSRAHRGARPGAPRARA